MPDKSSLLNLPFIQPAQAQKHITHNEALRTLDALVQLSVETRSQAPTTPEAGTRYIVAANATGPWVAHENDIALYEDNGWIFYTPNSGWQAYVLDEDIQVVWDGAEWHILGQPTQDNLNVQTLGINTGADTTNRLTVSADATLLSHDGASHRLKINKSTQSDTASLVFQSDFSGHAEMGLTGSADFALRVSADGTTFTNALSADSASGALTAPAGIGFGATTLGHYEEGTWTPRLTFGGDDTGVAYNFQFGGYVRIGSLVMLQCAINLSNKGTATGVAEIQDLPFDADPDYYPGEVFFVSGGSGLTVPKCRTRPGRKIQFFNASANGISWMNDGNFTNSTNLKLTLMHTV